MSTATALHKLAVAIGDRAGLAELFRYIDTDGSGTIELDELSLIHS